MIAVGIDRDGESRVLTIEMLRPRLLAEEMRRAGWKYALLLRDGKSVGGVRFSVGQMKRISWGEDD
jgi:hypothetical protein